MDSLSQALTGAAQAAQGIGVQIPLDGVASDAAEAAYASVVDTLTANGLSQEEAERSSGSFPSLLEMLSVHPLPVQRRIRR